MALKLVQLGRDGLPTRTWVLGALPLVFGRDVEGEGAIRFPENAATVSKEHARIRKGLLGHVLRDLGSANGTFVNDEPVSKHRLRAGDEIRIGGVRFQVEGHVEAQGPAWIDMTRGPLKGKSWPVTGTAVEVGSAADARKGIRIEAKEFGVSDRHAQFSTLGGHPSVRDLGSKNGTLVNGRRILKPTKLRGGDRIAVGTVEFRLRVG